MTANKDVCAYFYEALDQGRYRCKLCGSERRQAASTGYYNLVAHLTLKHEGYKVQYAATLSGDIRRLPDFGFVSEETSHRFQWMRWVVERNMPLSEVDNELTRSMSRWRSILSRVLLNGMHDIVKKVGKKFEGVMGILFGIMFDDWSNGSMHYVAVYVVLRTNGELRLQLLAVSPLEEGSQGTDAHVKLIDGMLDVYDKTLDMMAFVFAGNCNTCNSNQAIATTFGVPLVNVPATGLT